MVSRVRFFNSDSVASVVLVMPFVLVLMVGFMLSKHLKGISGSGCVLEASFVIWLGLFLLCLFFVSSVDTVFIGW